MPIAPRLIWPIRITIEPIPSDLLELDDDLREPIQNEDELRQVAHGRRFTVKAQIRHAVFGAANMRHTGDNEDTRSRAVIEAKTQNKYQIKPHWRIVEIIDRQNTRVPVDYKILEVRPSAQKDVFGLYLLFFESVMAA